MLFTSQRGFPDSSVGKESTCNAGDSGLIPGLQRSAQTRIQKEWQTPSTVPTHSLKTLMFSPILATLNISSVSLHFLISLKPTLDSH